MELSSGLCWTKLTHVRVAGNLLSRRLWIQCLSQGSDREVQPWGPRYTTKGGVSIPSKALQQLNITNSMPKVVCNRQAGIVSYTAPLELLTFELEVR